MKVEAFSFLWLKYVCAEFHVFPPFYECKMLGAVIKLCIISLNFI